MGLGFSSLNFKVSNLILRFKHKVSFLGIRAMVFKYDFVSCIIIGKFIVVIGRLSKLTLE
jgi:hypothetical protein